MRRSLGILIGLLLTSILASCSQPTPRWKQVETTWTDEPASKQTPGIIYLLSEDCQLTIRAIRVLDRPKVPVGDPISSWKPVQPENVCGSPQSNLEVYFRSTNSIQVLPEHTQRPWVFSTLPTWEDAYKARFIPTLPFSTDSFPLGFPGYVYLLPDDCRSTTSVVRVRERPHYRNANGSQELVLSNGTYVKNDTCQPPDPNKDIYLTSDRETLRVESPWVYSELPPQEAYKAGLIPSLPK